MIQAVVGRLASNSFLIKGWTLTIAGAFFGFAVTRNNGYLALVGVVPVTAFWLLDSYYLRAERLFRCLFEDVRKADPDTELFFMGATSKQRITQLSKKDRGQTRYSRVMFSTTLFCFYSALVVIAVVIYALL